MFKALLIAVIVIPSGIAINESMTKDIYNVDVPAYFVEMLDNGGIEK